MNATDTMRAIAPLTASDRCDRCSAAAKVRAVLPAGGELLFCGHHYRATSAGLAAAGARIDGDA